jgi:2-keto-4-pentenoate hydratase/2-oxohepta-3-ene-1,7-dioic acid hydratase in catechol pathway
MILAGTPGGVGFTRMPTKWLRPGNKIDLMVGEVRTPMHGINFV